MKQKRETRQKKSLDELSPKKINSWNDFMHFWTFFRDDSMEIVIFEANLTWIVSEDREKSLIWVSFCGY